MPGPPLWIGSIDTYWPDWIALILTVFGPIIWWMCVRRSKKAQKRTRPEGVTWARSKPGPVDSTSKKG